MKYFYSAIILFSVSLLTGCSSANYTADYQVSLVYAERHEQVEQQNNYRKISSISGDLKYKFCYEDSLVRIFWFVDSKQILFQLENETDYTIKIPWDDAVYVDEYGFNHRVIHSTIDYNDKERPQPPSVIIRGGLFEDSIFPSDYIKWIQPNNETSSSYWEAGSLFLDYGSSKVNNPGSYASFESAVKSNVGTLCQVMLPLHIGNLICEYVFTFKIDSVKAIQK